MNDKEPQSISCPINKNLYGPREIDSSNQLFHTKGRQILCDDENKGDDCGQLKLQDFFVA